MTSAALVLVAFGAATLASLAARAVGLRCAFVSAPHPLVVAHTEPVSYLGGPAVAAGALAALAALGRIPEVGAAAVVAGLLLLAIGLFDDLSPLELGRKLVLQFAAAAVPVSLGLGLPVSRFEAVNALAGAIWIVAVANAVNVTDVCDGLVAGLAAVAFFAFAAIEPASHSLALAAAGACLGFLAFNLPPASIFLGDAGSLLLGAWLAVPVLAPLDSAPAWNSVAASALVLGVPLFELVFLVAARRRRRVPWWRGSADHFSLRLQIAGLSRWQTDALAWLTGCGLAFLALAVSRLGLVAGAILGMPVAAAALGAWRLLLRWDPER